MTTFYARYKTDKKLEEEGQWVDFGDGVKVKVARLNSERSIAARRKLEKPYSKIRGSIPESIQEEILTKQVAEAVIIAWEGVTDERGKEIECTYENKVKILNEFKDFRFDVVTASVEAETFKAQQIEEISKNS